MTLGSFRLGFRTFKTALSVAICIILFNFFGDHSPMIASLAAVFALREDLSSTYSFGGLRIFGTVIGGLAAIGYYFLQQPFHQKDIIEIILIPSFVAVIIIFLNGINMNKSIIASVATFLVIVFGIPQGEAYLYIIQRTFDSFIGVIIAVAVNRLVKSPPQEIEEAISQKEAAEEVEKLKIKELEKEISELRKKLEDKKSSH
ncbi:FUSC family protein [Vagococcus elongatus]|uniref:Integral membrane bound transporter domain-containing protein n=1 Tax=Vagococcus elongatus TaxID=180344 RepID=A0A430ANE6_9ENTE|nr:FUSC family protein [Vagococcus elongatus]RSU09690.1 hypothetical protein CBF29_10960 [Vagococcus elongatus]